VAKEPDKKPPIEDALTPRRFPLDRVVAISLLVVGGISMFSSLGEYLNMSMTLNRLLADLHLQMPEFAKITYTDQGLAQPVGLAIITLEGLIFGFAVWATVRRITAKKLAFWVPIVGYVSTSAVIFGGQLICLMSDPAFIETLWAATQALQPGNATPGPTPSITVEPAPVA
jgi:hypothetical protein